MLLKYLVNKTENTVVQFFRYFGVTLACFSIDFAVLFICTEWLGIHYQISTFAGYSAGMILNYILSITWVFGTRRMNNTAFEFGIFMGIGILGMFINQGIMWLLTDSLGLYFMVSRLISAVFGYTWKFFARKFLLFYKKKEQP